VLALPNTWLAGKGQEMYFGWFLIEVTNKFYLALKKTSWFSYVMHSIVSVDINQGVFLIIIR